MSWSDLYLMALGPILALAAGLFIYLSATMGPSNRDPTSIGTGEGRGGVPRPGRRR
ncbi:hypothetical protein GOFOIKOB_2024 [Methylobacterium tardum]|jgi:hypothetical protein|uniref:hypothetical protein n=1 Tax=Methylobacterium tardum TaxID=374432 RepID=UPI001EDFDC93|nr:hypothetical protein [Methylobacterium tardum]URD39148.1 hypothetical protein M6G65_12505 [Methylobacterium tardum]GJE48990.1 hypothetical protein GOFOIKOB_2024 [Methylobacterium tardum]